MITTALWILASIFGTLAVILNQTNHIILSNWFAAISVLLLVISLFTHRVETQKTIKSKSFEEQSIYPVSKLHITDFAGVKGEVIIVFDTLTLFYGTSKLNQSVGELLRTFSDREKFERTRQPRSGSSSGNFGSVPITEETQLVMSVYTSEPRFFSPTGKLQLVMSDGKEILIQATTDEVAMFIGDAPLPVFSSVLNVVTLGDNFEYTIFSGKSGDESDVIEGISTFFGVSSKEVKDCIQGVATDRSLFNYSYTLENGSNLLIKHSHNRDFSPIRSLSSGELKRFMLDMAIRIATYSARIRPTILTVNQVHISSLDAKGWANFLEWVEKNRPPFQVVVDCCRRPSEGELSRALCYDAVGTDMSVTSFVPKTWEEFQSTSNAGL